MYKVFNEVADLAVDSKDKCEKVVARILELKGEFKQEKLVYGNNEPISAGINCLLIFFFFFCLIILFCIIFVPTYVLGLHFSINKFIYLIKIKYCIGIPTDSTSCGDDLAISKETKNILDPIVVRQKGRPPSKRKQSIVEKVVRKKEERKKKKKTKVSERNEFKKKKVLVYFLLILN